MTIKEIYNEFDKLGWLTFATVDENGSPETRIAHLRGFDDDGIYFMTMNTKPFYKQLKSSGKVSVCGIYQNTAIEHKEDGSPVFAPGFFMRLTGNVLEVSIDDIKAKNNPIFDFCIKDHARYNSMVVFVINSAKIEKYNYDFGKVNMDHKLERYRYSYNNYPFEKAGLTISDKCISCGKCYKKCSFNAIFKDGNSYYIDGTRCDECGDCSIVCPVKAIKHKGQ